MKYLINLLLLLVLINNGKCMHVEFESLLGKHISHAKEITSQDFKRNSVDKRLLITEFLNEELYGMPYNFITIVVDENDILQNITIHFRGILTPKFLDSFNRKYKEPDSILVMENKKTITESSRDDGFKAKLKKSSFDLREGTLEEKPLYIIWKKEDFQIKALLKHKQNISEMTFSVPSKDF